MLADNAALVTANDQFVRYLWDGTKTRLMGQAGVTVDFRVSKAVSLGLEVSANTVNDYYNSKKAGNSDWYFNALAGIKINLGKTYTQKTIPACCKPAPAPEPKVIEKVVEKIVEKPVPAPVAEVKKVEPLRRDVFFTIKSTQITSEEMAKVEDIVNYLKENPAAKVSVTGYADKGTGNLTINRNLSKKRAEIVAQTLKKKGVSADRIVTDFKGDTEQPFAKNDLNRVSICIAK